MELDDPYEGNDEDERPSDPSQERAVEELRAFFEESRDRVFFSRQVEVLHEREYFHWISNRAVRTLKELGVIAGERREIANGGSIHLLWHRSLRYYRRPAARLVKLVEAYADPNIGAALGLQGEALVLEGFAREQFLLHGRNTRTHEGRTGAEGRYDLDFIFSRDGRAYGVEVKNTLGYMEHGELRAKLGLCAELGIRPVIAARMLPKSWIKEIVDAGGFALVLGHQLYPWSHRDLAQTVKHELGLPVDAPRALEDGTMQRFVRWHRRQAV